MKYLKILALLALACLIPVIAQAQSSSMTAVDANAIPKLIQTVSIWIRVIAYTVSVGTIIYAGILYIGSGDNPSNSTTAKNALKAVVIGLTIIVLAEVIVRTTLGFVTDSKNQVGINSILHNSP